jgi:hypothetical protein
MYCNLYCKKGKPSLKIPGDFEDVERTALNGTLPHTAKG